MLLMFLQRFPFWKLVKFVITGGIALGVDMAIYYLLTRYGHVYYLLARTLSLGVAIIWSFTVNRQWTFRATEGDAGKQAVKFVIVIISTSLLSLGLMHIGVTLLRLHDLMVILIVSVITTLINFSAHSLWSYAVIKNEKPPAV